MRVRHEQERLEWLVSELNKKLEMKSLKREKTGFRTDLELKQLRKEVRKLKTQLSPKTNAIARLYSSLRSRHWYICPSKCHYRNNLNKFLRSFLQGEVIQFDVIMGSKNMPEAANVSGPNRKPVKGSKYAQDRSQSYKQQFNRQQRPQQNSYIIMVASH